MRNYFLSNHLQKMCQHLKEKLPTNRWFNVDVDPPPVSNISVVPKPQEEPDSDIKIDHRPEVSSVVEYYTIVESIVQPSHQKYMGIKTWKFKTWKFKYFLLALEILPPFKRLYLAKRNTSGCNGGGDEVLKEKSNIGACSTS